MKRIAHNKHNTVVSLNVGTPTHREIQALKTTWKQTSPPQRGILLNKLADLIEANGQELANIEALDVGKTASDAKTIDVWHTVACFRYYAGWADKIHGKTIQGYNNHLVNFTRHQPIGIVGVRSLGEFLSEYEGTLPVLGLLLIYNQMIVPWNFPATEVAWKLAPALACGNVCILKSCMQLFPSRASHFENTSNLHLDYFSGIHAFGCPLHC